MISDALPAINDTLLAKINDNAKPAIKQMEIGIYLRSENGIVLFCRFTFHYYLILHKHIKSIWIANHLALVDYGNKLLSFNFESPQLQLMLQGILIIRLKKPRPTEFIMNRNSSIKDYLTYLILFHFITSLLLCHSASLR